MIQLILCYKGTNMGMMLQALATIEYMNQSNIETSILEFEPKGNSKNSVYTRMKLAIKPGVIKNKMKFLKRKNMLNKYPDIKEAYKLRIEGNKQYIKQYLGKINKYSTIEELRRDSSNYEAVLIGSDQQWFPSALNSDIRTMMYVDDKVKRISYATSFGVGELPNGLKERAKEFLEKIDFLSVREATGAKIIKELTGKDPFIAVDPTLLFTADEWDKILQIEDNGIESEKYVVTYFLGNNIMHRQEAYKLAKSKHIKLKAIQNVESYCKNENQFADEIVKISSPKEFVQLIKNAEYVCTDSFHGTVFSLLYHVNFFSFYRYKEKDSNSRNSRINDLLNKINCSKRIVNGSGEIKVADNNEINFSEVDKIILLERNKSIEFLNQALH